MAGSDALCIHSSLRDSELFAIIFERHAAAIHRYLARRTEYLAVDDLVSEVFVIAFRTRREYDASYSDAAPWLFGIATNMLRHHRRSESRRLAMVGRVAAGPSDLVEPDFADIVAAHLDSMDSSRRMRDALLLLDERYADVLTLFAGPKLSYEEISRALDIPIGTVRSRLSRGRIQLRELLEDPGQYQGDTTDGTIRRTEERPQ